MPGCSAAVVAVALAAGVGEIMVTTNRPAASRRHLAVSRRPCSKIAAAARAIAAAVAKAAAATGITADAASSGVAITAAAADATAAAVDVTAAAAVQLAVAR